MQHVLLIELSASVCILLTLFDIMMVSRDLLWELKATFRVVAWTMMRMAWRTRHKHAEEKNTLRATAKKSIHSDR